MIGILDAFSRRVFRRRPADDRTDTEVLEVWLTPSLPRWDFIPNSDLDRPFRLVRASTTTDAVFALEEHGELAEALRSFTERNLPAVEQRCAIIDNKDQMILGWIDDRQPNVLEIDEERYVWIGCEAAFRLLAILHDPVDVAFWERLAHPENQ